MKILKSETKFVSLKHENFFCLKTGLDIVLSIKYHVFVSYHAWLFTRYVCLCCRGNTVVLKIVQFTLFGYLRHENQMNIKISKIAIYIMCFFKICAISSNFQKKK